MKIKESTGYRVFTVINYILLALIAFVMLFPYWNVAIKAFNDGADLAKGGVTFWPRVWSLENFKAIFADNTFFPSVGISVLRVVVGTLVSVLVQFMAAYTLTKEKLMHKKWITLFFMLPMFISAGMIPQYVLYSNLGLLNSFWVYILPGAFSFYNTIIIRTFMQSTIPTALYEAAYLDGATDIYVFFKIVLPLSLPVLATISLWSMVGHWNDWTTTLYYITDSSLHTVQYKMMQVVKETENIQKMQAALLAQGIGSAEDVEINVTSDSIISAQIVLTTLPIIAVYPFLQKYFVKGVTVGAVKG